MRKVEIDLIDLVTAFESGSYPISYFLDLDTGETVLINDDIRSELNRIYAAMAGKGDEPGVSFAEALEQSGAPEWMHELLQAALRVEEDVSGRYLPVPESREGYPDMEAFIETIQDQRLQERLSDAIRGRGAFRRFRNILDDHPREWERWHSFSEGQTLRRMMEWLADEGIEPVFRTSAG